MCRYAGRVLVLALLLSLSAFPVHAAAGDQQAVFLIGWKFYTAGNQTFVMDVAPLIDQGRTLVPVRYLALALGVPAEGIKYAAETRTVTLVKGSLTVELQVDSKVMKVNGAAKEVDTAPQNRDGRVFLPARFVAEALGYAVQFDQAAKAVVILPAGQQAQPVVAAAPPAVQGQGLIAAGRTFSVAAKVDGTVVGWGDSRFGQLAKREYFKPQFTPFTISEIPAVTAVATSRDVTAVIDSGSRVWWWGWLPDKMIPDAPLQVPGVSDAKQLAAGYDGFYILRADGTVWEYVFKQYKPEPALELKPIPELAGITAISRGVAVQSNGALWTMGQWNVDVRSVDEVNLNYYKAIRLPDLGPVTALTDRGVIRSDGTLWQNTLGSNPVWKQVPGVADLTYAVTFDGSSGLVWLGLRKDGTVVQWEEAWEGTPSPTVTPVPGLTDVVGIAVSRFNDAHGMALKRDGTVWGWGENTFGQVGDGTTENRSTPVMVPNLSLK